MPFPFPCLGNVGQKLSCLSLTHPKIPEEWLKPAGVGWPSANRVDLRKLKRLILEGKLAPCFPGCEDSATGPEYAAIMPVVHKLLKRKRKQQGLDTPPVVSDASWSFEECPICFNYYPILNTSKCCGKRVCTECFLQVQTSTAPTTPPNCPFCKVPNYTAKFLGARTAEERETERVEEQRVIEARIREREEEIRRDQERAQKRTEDEMEQRQQQSSPAQPAGTMAATRSASASPAAMAPPASTRSTPAHGAMQQQGNGTASTTSSSAARGAAPSSPAHTADTPTAAHSAHSSDTEDNAAHRPHHAALVARSRAAAADGHQRAGARMGHHANGGSRRYRVNDFVPTGMGDLSLTLDDINDLMLEQALYESMAAAAASDATTNNRAPRNATASATSNAEQQRRRRHRQQQQQQGQGLGQGLAQASSQSPEQPVNGASRQPRSSPPPPPPPAAHEAAAQPLAPAAVVAETAAPCVHSGSPGAAAGPQAAVDVDEVVLATAAAPSPPHRAAASDDEDGLLSRRTGAADRPAQAQPGSTATGDSSAVESPNGLSGHTPQPATQETSASNAVLVAKQQQSDATVALGSPMPAAVDAVASNAAASGSSTELDVSSSAPSSTAINQACQLPGTVETLVGLGAGTPCSAASAATHTEHAAAAPPGPSYPPQPPPPPPQDQQQLLSPCSSLSSAASSTLATAGSFGRPGSLVPRRPPPLPPSSQATTSASQGGAAGTASAAPPAPRSPAPSTSGPVPSAAGGVLPAATEARPAPLNVGVGVSDGGELLSPQSWEVSPNPFFDVSLPTTATNSVRSEVGPGMVSLFAAASAADDGFYRTTSGCSSSAPPSRHTSMAGGRTSSAGAPLPAVPEEARGAASHGGGATSLAPARSAAHPSGIPPAPCGVRSAGGDKEVLGDITTGGARSGDERVPPEVVAELAIHGVVSEEERVKVVAMVLGYSAARGAAAAASTPAAAVAAYVEQPDGSVCVMVADSHAQQQQAAKGSCADDADARLAAELAAIEKSGYTDYDVSSGHTSCEVAGVQAGTAGIMATADDCRLQAVIAGGDTQVASAILQGDKELLQRMGAGGSGSQQPMH